MNLRSFPLGGSNTHFLGLSLILNFVRRVKVASRLLTSWSAFQDYDDVIDVDLHDVPDELAEASVHAPLVGGSCVLESKRHGDIAVGAEWGDEGSCELVGLLHRDLMIPRICV